MSYIKGEWTVERIKSGDFRIQSGSEIICWTHNGDKLYKASENSEANAHLIAASPAMYEALVDADNQLCYICGKDCKPWECASHMRLMNVINKAEGAL